MRRGLPLLVLPVLALAGCGGGHSHKPRANARPPLHALATINCATLPAWEHRMGMCLPHPASTSARPKFLAGTSITGPDLSNNDPVFGVGNWQAIANRSRFAYLKSIEGTGFYDNTAQGQAGAAKAVRLPIGGYDFLHVCGNSAYDEAAFFVRALRAQGLLGPGTLPPAADAEYGSGGCGTGWMVTWVNTVYALDGNVCPIVYTGAWWWNPNLGSYWPTCAGRSVVSWISGYGVGYPYMPSGLSHLDFWQFTDAGYNGASTGDLSAWMHDLASFQAFASVGPPPDPYGFIPHGPFADGSRLVDEYWTVRHWDDWRCQSPPRRHQCVVDHDHLIFTRGRISWLAHHRWGIPRHPNWRPNDGGLRWSAENLRINATRPTHAGQWK